jgi:O-antigen/teichoic acid export membrane protein
MIQTLLAKIRRDRNLSDLLKHSGIMYASGIVSTLLITIQQISTASVLGAADYGRFAAVFGSGLLVILLVDVRTWEVGTKLLARPILDDDRVEIVRVSSWLLLVDVVTGLLAGLVVLALAQPIATYLLRAPDLAWLVALFAISTPFRTTSSGIGRTTLRMYDRFDWLSYKSIAYGLARLVCISGAVVAGYGLVGALVGAILAEVIGALILTGMMWRLQRQKLPDQPLFDLTRPRQFTEGARLMRGLWLSATLWGLQLEIFVPILALLTTPAQVGIFRSGLDIAEIIEKVIIPFGLVLFPQVMKVYEHGEKHLFIRLIRQSTIIMTALILPVAVGIVVFASTTFLKILGDEYMGTGLIVVLLVIGYLIYGVLLWTRPTLIALGALRELNFVNGVTVTLVIVGLFALVPTQGAVAGAVLRSFALSIPNLIFLLLFMFRLRNERQPTEGLA